MAEKSQSELEKPEDDHRKTERVEEILPSGLHTLKPEDQGTFEKILTINRTSKVTKGGKRLGFNALAVVGDRKGAVGCGYGKANEVSVAIRKALNDARRSMFKVPIQGSTIPHEIIGHFGAAKVLLKPAGEGTGVIAGSVTRAICDAAGIRDILTKSLGSNNPSNVLKATVAGLKSLKYKRDDNINGNY